MKGKRNRHSDKGKKKERETKKERKKKIGLGWYGEFTYCKNIYYYITHIHSQTHKHTSLSMVHASVLNIFSGVCNGLPHLQRTFNEKMHGSAEQLQLSSKTLLSLQVLGHTINTTVHEQHSATSANFNTLSGCKTNILTPIDTHKRANTTYSPDI